MDIELRRLQLPDTCWPPLFNQILSQSFDKKAANLQHVVPIIIDPEVVVFPVEQLKYDFGPHNESAINWPDVLNSNLNDRTALEYKKRATASLPVPSDYSSTVAVFGVSSEIGRINVRGSVVTRARKCVGQVYIAVNFIGRRAVVYTRLR